ncbi:omptin family outer membrane protease [Candidatus Haliotispira prima]|uniref:Omptin family outer membrane protease n=1 Tax=Candidatus Haliotispira prima TaxID=3034016 RepID=A0ABY8MIK3_9SPIO|nr:omptin family outer membrane protease [Candidatus Haliotispira prima]
MNNQEQGYLQSGRKKPPGEDRGAPDHWLNDVMRAEDPIKEWPINRKMNSAKYFPPMVVRFFIGYQGMRSHEYVVGNPTQKNSRGYKSELIWNSFKNLLLGVNVSGRINKIHYVGQINTTLSLAQNFIYDYDWLYQDLVTEDAASNYSRHDTVQNIMIEFLFRLGYPVLEWNDNRISIGPGVFGSFSHWDAFDGELRYLVDSVGNFINLASKQSGRSLSYGVFLLSFQAYIELTQNFTDNFEVRLALAYSPLTLWLGIDNHYMRNLLFYDFGFWGQQVFGELQFNFWNTKRTLGFSVSVTGRYLFETIGSTLTYNTDSEGVRQNLSGSSFLSSGLEQGSVQIYLGGLFTFPKNIGRKAR